MKKIKNIIGLIFNKNNEYDLNHKELIGNVKKEIFLTKCSDCCKRIAVLVTPDNFSHGAYSCNECVPRDSSIRNGIDEAFETDLFDEIKDEKYKNIKEK